MTASLLKAFSSLAKPYSSQSTRTQGLAAMLLLRKDPHAKETAFFLLFLPAIGAAGYLRRQGETAREKPLLG